MLTPILVSLAVAFGMAPPDSGAVGPRWVLTSTEPSSGEVIQAWFELRRLENQPVAAQGNPVQLELEQLPTMSAWFSNGNLPCGSQRGSATALWIGRVRSADTALVTCAVGDGYQTTRLVMLVLDSTTTNNVRPIASDIITVHSFGFDPPRWLIELFSIAGGFVTGGGLYLLQRRSERAAKSREHRDAIESELVTSLSADLVYNKTAVAHFVQSASGTTPISLYVDAGMILARHDRVGPDLFAAAYVERVRALFRAFQGYNRVVEEWKNVTGSARARAEQQARTIADLLNTAFERAARSDKGSQPLLASARELETNVNKIAPL